MASEQLILKQDGYLDVGLGGTSASAKGVGGGTGQTVARNIVYHPNLNVILVFDSNNQLKILDVHSGVILQNYQLAPIDAKTEVNGRYMPLQDKILIWDGYALGFRGDYNGVLLLDTILQPAIFQNDDIIKLELLLTEAIIFQACLKGLEQDGFECPCDVSQELAEKIKLAESTVKKSIKAQRWNTICLELPYSSLKLVANNVMIMLKRLDRHIPALAIASAINERLSDLLTGGRITDPNWHATSFQRILMHSEAVRRQTFEKWPHMDYKWALPDQMAQAGFYHQPSSTGEDRAMCFTCSVCLVCWEKTDEPWSEHERHSPVCPFVKGEYTQNVPLAVTYATNPALVAMPYVGFDVISNSDYSNVLCTSCTSTGDITIFSIERQLREMHTFNISSVLKKIFDGDELFEWAHVTAICVLPNERAQCKMKAMHGVHPNNAANNTNGGASAAPNTAGCGVQCSSTSTLRSGVVGSKIVLGLSVRLHTGEHVLRMAVLNIVEVDRTIEVDDNNVGGNAIDAGGAGEMPTESGTSNFITPKVVVVGGVGDGNNVNNPTIDNVATGADDNGGTKPSPVIFENEGYNLDELNWLQMEKSGNGGNNKNVADDNYNCEGSNNDDKCEITAQLEMFLENELTKMEADLPEIEQYSQDVDMPANGVSIVHVSDVNSTTIELNSNANIDMDPNYFKEKLLAACAVAQQKHQQQQQQQHNYKNINKNNNNNNNIISNIIIENTNVMNSGNSMMGNGFTISNINNNNNNNNNINNMTNNNNNDMLNSLDDMLNTDINLNNNNNNNNNNNINNNNNNNNDGNNMSNKVQVREEIDVVVESCTFVKRMNALTSRCSSGSHNIENDGTEAENDDAESDIDDTDIVEITEILPIDGNCNQLLVKLLKKKAPECVSTLQLIMETPMADMDNDDGLAYYDINSDEVSAQLLVYSYEDSVIASEHTMALTFTRAKCPQQLCIVPSFQSTQQHRASKVNSNLNATTGERDAFEEGALCVVCADGTIEIYSLADFHLMTVVEEGGEPFVSFTYCRSLERLCGCTRSGILIFYSLNDVDTDSGDEMLEIEDDYNVGIDDQPQQQQQQTSQSQLNNDASVTDGGANTIITTTNNATGAATTTTMSGGRQIDKVNDGILRMIAAMPQMSPSPSVASVNSSTTSTANLLAFKTTELTLDELRTLHDLTLFDPMLSPYTAEVPSCFNGLVQAQKLRKQNVRDDTQFTKTWRLHNDATSWDEHVIELNLTQPVTLGHVDLKFQMFQPNHALADVQVTLLKQYTSGFGYRMKGMPPAGFNMRDATDNAIHMSTNNSDAATENPVLSEEYLQAHNAEILAGPIDMSSCFDLSEVGGTVTLTSPKLFKTRTRNLMIHINTTGDNTKERCGKTREERVKFKKSSYVKKMKFVRKPKKDKSEKLEDGWDALHEISINVRGVKTQTVIPNERQQRIAMLESNLLIGQLFGIVSSAQSAILAKNLALDILTWICSIRLNRFRSPKSERIKHQINKSTAATNTDLLAQQFECIALSEKYLENMMRHCIIRADRSMAHKCIKLMSILTTGSTNLPTELQALSTLDNTITEAITKTFNELPSARYASVVRWYSMLTSATSSPKSHNGFSELCVKLLMNIAHEIEQRWDPYSAILGTRFGLHGFPFETEIFDYDFPSVSKIATTMPTTLVNMIRSSSSATGGTTSTGDMKKLFYIDGVDFRTFPHLIKLKSFSNQLRGLMEVEQLHFCCAATSEATRIDSIDNNATSHSANNNGNLSTDDVYAGAIQPDIVDIDFQMKDVVSAMLNMMSKNDKQAVSLPNSIGNPSKVTLSSKEFLELCEANQSKNSPLGNISFGQLKVFPNMPGMKNGKVALKHMIHAPVHNNKLTMVTITPPPSAQQSQQQQQQPSQQKEQKHEKNQQQKQQQLELLDRGNSAIVPTGLAWHKLLTPPPKQMIVIDRMHSGARRFVVLDFGSPILLTDVVMPNCDELATLIIDIWCFDEEIDCVRLVQSNDIGMKTLVLSDLQPPPICRFVKITIIGRIGMSSTKCKIPLGSFFGHTIVLESDGYADSMIHHIRHTSSNLQAQIRALHALQEDVHCRYSLASCKLSELLLPIMNCELSNLAHMQAFINKQRDEETSGVDNSRIVTIYEECISLQHQLNVIRNVIHRLEVHMGPANDMNTFYLSDTKKQLELASRDKLRVLGQNLIEILLHFSFEYGIKSILPIHQLFTVDVAKQMFNAFVVYGDAHIQLATCSLLVRMCCFQSWWGDFLADIFCNLYSSQNSKIFPQDRIFFLLTYLGRKSIAMGPCRSIVIDAILKTLAKLLAPISPRYQEAAASTANMHHSESGGLWSKTDLQLITWLLLFLSACLDDNTDRKDKSANRWDFMSCESDFTKSRTTSSTPSANKLRCYKRRIVHSANKYTGVTPCTDWGKTILMLQNEHPGIFMELTGKFAANSKSTMNNNNNNNNKSGSTATTSSGATTSGGAGGGPATGAKDSSQQDGENNFEKGLRTLRLHNVLIVIRGLISLLLEMDFTCNMDQFLLTCKVIARLVSACRPVVQLSKIITTAQLEQLLRLAVWNDQNQPWAVHAITCLLQDLLDADKQFNDNDATPTNDGSMISTLENTPDVRDNLYNDYSRAKYSYLPSLIECEDTEFDEILSDIDLIERSNKNSNKKDTNARGINIFKYFCKSISSAMDARLETGLDWHVEVNLRWLTMDSTLFLYSSLPHIMTNEYIMAAPEVSNWPDYITDIWSGPEYNGGPNTYCMFKNVFDCIFADLHLEDTWVHLEQVLQMWLTLNGELADKSYSAGLSQTDVPKIPFGAHAVQGLLLALAWHNDIKLRTWSLGFQCLFLACNSLPIGEEDADTTRIHDVIVNDENFEKMLLRFYSGYGISSSIITNRCAGLTICKHLHELITWLHKKGKTVDGVITCKRKLKDTLLQVVLQLVQPGGAITNQHGPIDAQSHLVRDVLAMGNDKADINVALNIIECASFLVFNNISNSDKLQCHGSTDGMNSSNAFSSLFANVLGNDHAKHNATISDNALNIGLLKLCSSLSQTELPRQPSEASIPEEEELPNESQTDETKAEQLNLDANRPKTVCVADTVLRHFPTMKRLLGSLSHCNSKSLSSPMTMYAAKVSFLQYEPITTGDAVFTMLLILLEKASSARLVVAPICKYLETSTLQRNSLPRLQLSEPFLCFVCKVLEMPSAVQIFTQLGGIQIICQNLVRLNKALLNMQPGLISLIMQHMTKNTKMKLNAHASSTANVKKSSSSGSSGNGNAGAPQTRVFHDGLINFAPFCTVTPANVTAQPADTLIMTTAAPHRRPRTPAWSYMFYPNESHVTLNITLPTAILLKEVQLLPHIPTLATCPSAVAMEVARDYGVGPVPVGPPLNTTGMTCIRLKLDKPEIATAIVLRLYRPKDCSSIGLSQLAILGNTIFATNNSANSALNVGTPMAGGGSGCSHSNSNNNNSITINDGVQSFNMSVYEWNQMKSTGNSGSSSSAGGGGGGGETLEKVAGAVHYDGNADEDAFAKTSVAWVRILSRCFNAASNLMDAKLNSDVIGASAAYPGFLESCCSLMNIMPMTPIGIQHCLDSVLLKFSNYSCELCLSLIRILLWHTTPQAYRLSNESICDLLYEMVMTRDAYVQSKVQVLLDWVVKLRTNYNNETLRCNNPQSGFIKCIASILWTVQDAQLMPQLHEFITPELFDACLYWIDTLHYMEPLKMSFDSLLCSMCHIKSEYFNQLLLKVGVHLQQQQQREAEQDNIEVNSETEATNRSCTDDNKGISGNEWFAHVAAENLNILLQRPAYLTTLALACQSPRAVYQLVDSGLPKLLAHALYEYCCSLLPTATTTTQSSTSSTPSTSSISSNSQQQQQPPLATPSELPSTSQAHADDTMETASTKNRAALLSCAHVPKILDFFSECCAEGLMRDWLGTQQGVIFWQPLLELLCNNRPLDGEAMMWLYNEPMQQANVRIERATINFFSRVTACHPKNQDILINLLIDVIRKPPIKYSGGGKSTISGFTRQIVLQLLLENERILVSVRCKEPMLTKDLSVMGFTTTTSSSSATNNGSNNNNNSMANNDLANNWLPTLANNIPMALVSHHPSKRINAHHLLFYVSSNTKCQEILQNYISEIRTPDNDLTPGLSSATPVVLNELVTSYSAACNPVYTHSDSYKKYNGVNIAMLDDAIIDVGGYFNQMPKNFVFPKTMSMECLSMAAGVTAKDKRLKDVKNQVTAAIQQKEYPQVKKLYGLEEFMLSSSGSSITSCAQLVHAECPDVLLTSDTSISQLLAMLHSRNISLSTPCINLSLMPAQPMPDEFDESVPRAVNMEPLPSPLQRFSSRGGLSLLAQYLPTVYPENLMRKTATTLPEKEKSPPMTDWVKLEPSDDIYEDFDDPVTEPVAKHGTIASVPQHSLAAFGLLLRLPGYSDVLLRDKLRAQCLLRLVLGVTGDGEGNDIFSLSLASSLPTLPFEVFRQLLDCTPLHTDDGMLLRLLVIEVGALHLVLNSLSVFTHQTQTSSMAQSNNNNNNNETKNGSEQPLIAGNDDKSHMYWAKGTGFGTGSTAQSWNVEQALMRQKSEEEHVTVLLQVLAAYINPGDKMAYDDEEPCGELPSNFPLYLQQSCLLPALSSYLRNDSVLDITRHIPLYRAILQLLRALSFSQQLVRMLQPQQSDTSSVSISELLVNMKTCVDTYAKRLKVNKKSNLKGQTQPVTVTIDDGDDEGLAMLIPDIHETSAVVQKTLNAEAALMQANAEANGDVVMELERLPKIKSLEERYMEIMKKMQFDTYDMMVEAESNGYRFVVSHHFEKMVRMAGDRYHPSRVKRLAQEAVTLSTSLPLSYSSSVFVRCDTDRLDVMKVLITGPADTPYANGCFEFDVFFPPDYPNLPMLINLETTGRHSVRFNPNLYNDGKVCLSVLNTWHGRPEEKWNAQTSSFLQVLVSIQSLILVPEPYFNEPGFERSRGTPSGTQSSREYNSNIYQACVRWAMLEQIRNPNACFRDVIHTHFWLKRKEICAQIETWIEELSKPQYSGRNNRTISFNSMVLRRQYRHLREELAKLKVPKGLEDLDEPFNPYVNLPVLSNEAAGAAVAQPTATTNNALSVASNTISSDNNNNSNKIKVTILSDTISNEELHAEEMAKAKQEEMLKQAQAFDCDFMEIVDMSSSSDESFSHSNPEPMLVSANEEFTNTSTTANEVVATASESSEQPLHSSLITTTTVYTDGQPDEEFDD